MGGVVRWQRILKASAVTALAFALPAFAFPRPPAAITAIETNRRGDALEVRVLISGRPHFHVARQGNELQIDFDHVLIEIPSRPLSGKEVPPLSALRATDQGGGRARIALEVDGKTDYALALVAHDLIIRLAPAGKAPDLAETLLDDARRIGRRERKPPEPPAEPRRQQVPSRIADARTAPALATNRATSTERDRVRLAGHALVVVDPGHGGYDPGTETSGSGVAEKDLALAISRRLKEALEARGAEVRLTRYADTFLPLPQRTGIANRADADLFVSIHLNSSPNRQTTGIEVYYLNNTTDRATIKLARIENGGASVYGARSEANLNYILADLRQNYKAGESAALARTIEADTVTELDDTFGVGVRPLGAKMGPFYVLVGVQMPAVLVECGFLSNPVEAERLATPAYQDRMADGIASAIVRYLNADLAVGNL